MKYEFKLEKYEVNKNINKTILVSRRHLNNAALHTDEWTSLISSLPVVVGEASFKPLSVCVCICLIIECVFTRHSQAQRSLSLTLISGWRSAASFEEDLEKLV